MKNKYIDFIIWAIFVIAITYFKFNYHELWKDEWQAWFVAKDKSLAEVFSFLYYEGHPALWYIYLKIFTFFSSLARPEYIIHFAHTITVAAGLYFLFVKFRLPTIVKVLLALSYFVFFEYGIVNRGYFLVILFAFWAASLLKKEDYSRVQLGVVLFLLCQTEVYGALMAIALGFYVMMKEKNIFTALQGKDIIGLAAGLLFFVISVFPRSSGHVSKTSAKKLEFIDKILTSFQGNLSNTYAIGSTNDTFTYGWTSIGLLISMLCLAGIGFVFYKNKILLKTFLMFLAMMIAFSVLFFLGGIRQWGMGFIFFIALLEIRGLDIKKELLPTLVISVFAIFNIVHNGKAVVEEKNIPFTNAELAGQFIKEKIPEKVPIVAINKFEATPVIGYARRSFYELPDGVPFSYFRWVDKIYLPVENELKLFAKFKGVGGIVVLSPKPLDADRFPSLQLWQKWEDKNYKNENYYLYTLALSGAREQKPVTPLE